MQKLLALIFLLLAIAVSQAEEKPPVRFALVGLVHDHAGGFIPRLRGRTDVQLVGIVEANTNLWAGAAKRFHLDSDIFFPTLDALLAHTNVQALATFTTTFDHRRVVEEAAKHDIHVVMMEKPLAVTMEHARAIEKAAKKGNIQIIV